MSPAAEPSTSSRNELEKFEAKVKRCIVLDDVTPHVNVAMIQTALGQFGSVVSVEILTHPLDSKFAARRVIVEMRSPKEAAHAVKEIQDHLLMIKGVPRPVKAMRAEPTLFAERPRKVSNSKLACKWVQPGDADWDIVFEHKRMAKRHLAESNYLMQELRKQEEKLAQEQEEKVKENIKKLDEIYSCLKDNVMQRLSRYYGVRYDGGL